MAALKMLVMAMPMSRMLLRELPRRLPAARIISAETGIPCYQLDMAMAGDSWFSAMEHNIDTLKEALE